MSNAGSALMGIGRASGENRAVAAAQQAIDSPLLEVSIDGARGILFNIIGGNDLSMHEINTAAETITSAADPDANIIFGATINPDIEGEVIITVVATGFDAAYFTKREAGTTGLGDTVESASAGVAAQRGEESVLSGINTDLESHEDEPAKDEIVAAATDFTSKDPMPNIWAIDDGKAAEKDDDASVDEPTPKTTQDEEERAFVTGDLADEELEKPSFLRRLRGRKQSDDQK
jgi:hypothetical protein